MEGGFSLAQSGIEWRPLGILDFKGFSMRSVFLAISLLPALCSTAGADYLLNCRLMEPGPSHYRQHCKEASEVLRLKNGVRMVGRGEEWLVALPNTFVTVIGEPELPAVDMPHVAVRSAPQPLASKGKGKSKSPSNSSSPGPGPGPGGAGGPSRGGAGPGPGPGKGKGTAGPSGPHGGKTK